MGKESEVWSLVAGVLGRAPASSGRRRVCAPGSGRLGLRGVPGGMRSPQASAGGSASAPTGVQGARRLLAGAEELPPGRGGGAAEAGEHCPPHLLGPGPPAASSHTPSALRGVRPFCIVRVRCRRTLFRVPAPKPAPSALFAPCLGSSRCEMLSRSPGGLPRALGSPGSPPQEAFKAAGAFWDEDVSAAEGTVLGRAGRSGRTFASSSTRRTAATTLCFVLES